MADLNWPKPWLTGRTGVSVVSFSSVEQFGHVDDATFNCVDHTIISDPQPVEVLPTFRPTKSGYVNARSRLVGIFP
jgi:hypothetical protein